MKMDEGGEGDEGVEEEEGDCKPGRAGISVSAQACRTRLGPGDTNPQTARLRLDSIHSSYGLSKHQHSAHQQAARSPQSMRACGGGRHADDFSAVVGGSY